MIDSRAVVDPSARIAPDVVVGPFSVIGPGVEISAGTWIGPHVVIQGPTRIGRDNRIFQFASLGEMPQDKKYDGEPTSLEIGDRNTIREYCTINRGTFQDAGVTWLGDDNWIMAYVHIAHDCQVGDRTIFANGASVSGHVKVGNDVVLGGFALVYQHCRLGDHSFLGFACGVNKDVPPFVTVAGYRAEPYGINAEGLRRRSFPNEEIMAIRTAYRMLYRSGMQLEQAIEQIQGLIEQYPRVQVLVDFLRQRSVHGIVR